jgi:NAD(P)-dependent dehydrogenase (short-subunit alcohol dehydrogenase family)
VSGGVQQVDAGEPVVEDPNPVAAVADLVYFLISLASGMISGQNIAIDGGW